MAGIEQLFSSLPWHWVILGLITAVGLSVVFIRGLIRLAVRVFIVGAIGVILLGIVYAALKITHFSL
ncbi:MAG TPA: hypothetical protein VJ182_05365 [Anaerolineales bacterium]|nr:hypothetical protein [Anaerolineales bacterium]